ncbi:beta-ketoacyl synthase N-terminal-like domain-containing protein [Leeia sp.]|uniref:beta-ketoacyl synthase N-terminal-like domain-containing protein n=1 Tax=Leeia sp. TaxID=2884678 RepID=UPI0035B1CDDD
MRRVWVTGMGIVSCLGNDLATVTRALQTGQSGIRQVPAFAEAQLSSQVAGVPDLGGLPMIDRKLRRFMGDAAVYAYHAMQQAVDDAALPSALLHDSRTALFIGSGMSAPQQFDEALGTLRGRGIDKLRPYYIPQVMSSTVAANLAQAFQINGPSFGITAACATSAHCIGTAWAMIRSGLIDRAWVGGAEEVSAVATALYEPLGALTTRYNHTPAQACRPFAQDRDGFAIAGGAGVLLLEAADCARQRKARVYAELSGYGASNTASDMVQPDSDGILQAMQQALAQAGEPVVDYLNPHATATVLGDRAEVQAIRRLFGEHMPLVSATKGLSGHSIGAISAHEAIFCLLMMQHGFVAGSANLDQLDPEFADLPVVRQNTPCRLDTVLSNSIGFGGTNASLLFQRTD